MMEERAASQAIFRSGAAGRLAGKKSGGSELVTALVVIAVVIGMLVLVFNFAK